MKNTTKQILFILLYILISFTIHAQSNLSWIEVNTDKYSIKIPSDWTQKIDLPVRKAKSGLIIDKQMFDTPKEKGYICIDVTKYDYDKGISCDDIYKMDSLDHKRIFNGTTTKQAIPNPCKIYFIINYHADNPFLKKIEYMKKHTWLYEQGKSVYALTAMYEKETFKDYPNLLEIINNIQKSFTLK